ncbi:MAG: HK97 gp10 family phage protein [Methanobrevibacter sp.]|nr:HK97 gp10 family phage protein [Methanobrevibacter sp.]
MVKVTIKVDESKIPTISQQIPEIKKKGLNYAGQGMLRHLKQNSPVDHGKLKSWFFNDISDSQIDIRTPAEYAAFVNDGTGIYGPYKTPIIHPTIGKKFAFQVGGNMIYTNVIKGQKGQHFVEKSIEQTNGKLAGYFIKAVHEVLK